MSDEPNLNVRQKDVSNEAILEQGKRIRALHEIISRPDLSFDEQIDETAWVADFWVQRLAR
jgi:hypothetical protein